MIFFFCGAAKNASHFQMFVLTESLDQQRIKFEQVGNEIFHDHDLKAGKKLLGDLDKRKKEIFICKGHWSKKRERDLLLSYENIRIFLIWRDMRDVLVSQYFYDINKFGKYYRDFPSFYWLGSGRAFLCNQVAYMLAWTFVADNPKVYFSHFSELKTNFRGAANDLLAFAEIKDVDLDDLEKRLGLDRLRIKHNDPNGSFFRRGSIGDHLDVINSDKIYKDIEDIENSGGTRLAYHYFTSRFMSKLGKLSKRNVRP